MKMEQSSCDCSRKNSITNQKMGGRKPIRLAVMVSVLLSMLHSVTAETLKFQASSDSKMKNSESLSLLWGIADTTAYVGKIFTYTLPADAFQGNVVHYTVTEVEKGELPSWLTFNALKTELKGVPGPQDKGRIYLEVVATGDDNSKAYDVFSIEILDDTVGAVEASKHTGEHLPKYVRCRREEPQTIMTLIVDCDLENMKPNDKISLLDNLVSHLNLAPEMLKILPVGQKAMFDRNALVAGPGNVEVPKFAGSLISWMVGCGSVEKDHMNILQLVESSAASGDMSSAIGHGIIGWHVTNTRFLEKPRKRRQAVTATPTMTVDPPTKMTDMTKATISSTSTYIAPSKTVEVQPTSTYVKPVDESSSTDAIAPSETVKMTQTVSSSMQATAALPSKTYTMSSSDRMTKTEVMPSSTETTTQSTTTPITTTSKPTTPKPTTKPTTKPIPTPTPLCPPKGSSKPPMINNYLDDVTVTAGSIERNKIPDDTFFDCNADATADLDLFITFQNGTALPKGFWLSLVKKIFRPYVILTNPLNQDVGVYNLRLVASNFFELSESMDFTIEVTASTESSNPPNHEITMTIDTDYDTFMSDMDNRIDLSRKMANLFGDKNPSSLNILRIERGSVEFSWTNSSLSSSRCPVSDITSIVNKIMNEDGSLTEEAIDAMQPYALTGAESAPLGACKNNPRFPSRQTRRVPATTVKPPVKTKPSVTLKPSKVPGSKPTIKYEEKSTTANVETTPKDEVAAAGAGGGSDIWITTVVPAIVVVIVLIIALIIACCLYRKKRKGKMKLQEQNKFSNNKGVPVIFADEYDDKPNESSRPLIMEDEKPPMPPPEYQRASSETSGNSSSTQPIDDKYTEEIEMDDTDVTSPLYSPPPPVTSSNYNNKPPHVQSSRGPPPPYVPP